ncbi:hypothetical protein RZE82_02175 [Mollicutes bacterium LVI A0039]|nr:hypothetical protein RZE82_02175 [Mollicutes bacterium LVI A0039]
MFNQLLHIDTNKRLRKQNKLTKKQNKLIKEQNHLMKKDSVKDSNLNILNLCSAAVDYMSSSNEKVRDEERLRNAFDAEIERMDKEINELEKNQEKNHSDIMSPEDLFDM